MTRTENTTDVTDMTDAEFDAWMEMQEEVRSTEFANCRIVARNAGHSAAETALLSVRDDE